MMKNELRGLRAKCNIVEDACLLSREDIYHALCEKDKTHRFIDEGSGNRYRKAPWDEIGITYSFNITRWASKDGYEYRIKW